MNDSFKGFLPPIENWSKLPHQLIDMLPDMKERELKVTLYLLRHTWGYQEFGKLKQITIDEFMDGRKRTDGSRMDGGTGMSKQSVISGIQDGIDRGTLIEEVDDKDKARIKKSYRLAEPGDFADVKNLDTDPPSDVKNLDIKGQKFAHRSEKDTSGKKLKKKDSVAADAGDGVEKVSITLKNGEIIHVTPEEKRIRDLTDIYIEKGLRLSVSGVNGSYGTYRKHIQGFEKIYGKITPAEFAAAYDDYIEENDTAERPQAYEKLTKMLDRRRQKAEATATKAHVCPLCEANNGKVRVQRPDGVATLACPNLHAPTPIFSRVVWRESDGFGEYQFENMEKRVILLAWKSEATGEWVAEADNEVEFRAANRDDAVATFVRQYVRQGV